MPGDNIILVGFMGAGKSACGRMLARRLGRCFVETDDMIVARDGRNIPDIFRQDGEAAFRRLETEALEALRLKSGDVIATGGGLPCRDGRMEVLRALGTVVWLRDQLPADAQMQLAVCFEWAREGIGRQSAGEITKELQALHAAYTYARDVMLARSGKGIDK